MADATGISKSTVHRVWTAFSIQPHRQKHFELSTDPSHAHFSLDNALLEVPVGD